jgi:hypothetical protein
MVRDRPLIRPAFATGVKRILADCFSPCIWISAASMTPVGRLAPDVGLKDIEPGRLLARPKFALNRQGVPMAPAALRCQLSGKLAGIWWSQRYLTWTSTVVIKGHSALPRLVRSPLSATR